jgi:phage shock protein PspC (stress-responsive transcriptional regulator)
MRDRLYRSRDDRVLFGVCGGVADWLDLDPSLVRIVFALLVITGGVGLLLYIIMAIVVPEEPDYFQVPMAPGTGTPVPGTAPATGGTEAAATGAATDAGTATAGAGVGPSSPGAYPPGTWMTEREARRAARRAARQQRRSERDGRAGLIFGSILVIVGVWFLIQRYIPSIDSDFLGPIVLIAIGAIVLAGALGRGQDDTPAKPR